MDAKPYPDFPLFRHASGQWAKKIRGKLYYFGTDSQKALQRYLNEKDDLYAGRTPRPTSGSLTVGSLCDRYLGRKRLSLDAGELASRTLADYFRCCASIVSAFGSRRLVADLGPDDFASLRSALAKIRSPVALANEIQRVRSVFKFAMDNRLISEPVNYGSGFDKPTRKTIRQAKHAKGSRMLESEEVRRIIAAAKSPLKAMVLLGLNCGFGQTDVAGLPRSAVDLKTGWVDYPRPKTAVPRRVPLWPETVAAIRDALKHRPTPKDAEDADLVFVTKYGKRWVRANIYEDEGGMREVPIDSVRLEYNKVLKELGIKKPGGFYNLRHTFRTVADGCRDQPAVDAIMGHSRDDDMATHYRERIDDERLVAVVNHVRSWLWPQRK